MTTALAGNGHWDYANPVGDYDLDFIFIFLKKVKFERQGVKVAFYFQWDGYGE